MRNRRNSNVKNIKDYIVPIITFGLIFILLYVAFSGGDDQDISIKTNTDIISQGGNGIGINFDDSDTKAIIIDDTDKKTSILSGDALSAGDTVMVEKGSVSFEIPDEAKMTLNKNGELLYGKDSNIILNSSALWVESENDIIMNMKFAKVRIGKDSVVNLEQNEVSSTVYLLRGTAEVDNLAGVGTFLSQGKQLKISNKDASKDDIDLAALKEDFDDYFKISDWYLKNNGSVALSDTPVNNLAEDSGNILGGGDDSDTVLGEETQTRIPLTTSKLLNFDTIYDEGSVPTQSTTISGSFSDDLIASIEIQGKKADLNIETKTFTLASVDTSNQSNDIIVRVFDVGNNVIAKYLYTLYYSGGVAETNTVSSFATINTTSYPVNGSDFIISTPTVVNGETYLDENTMYGTVKNPDVTSVLVNGFKLSTFNGTTFRYHAYKRFTTLGEGVNNYEIKYLGKDGNVILKKYITINKKSQAVAAPKVVTPVEEVEPEL